MAPRIRLPLLATSVLVASSAWSLDGGYVAKGLSADLPCFDCHGDKTLDTDLDSDETLSLFVDREAYGRSVHKDVECTECHVELKGKAEGHKGKPFATAREYAVKFSDQCRECHFQNYTKTLDSVHHALIAKGKLDAAVCTDCHGAHDTGRAAEPRSRISRTCANCHEKIADVYTKSVHGAALLAEENPDVPTCTDCHRAHDIVDPKAGEWRLATPQMCGSCHTNEKMMKKYELSTNVLSSYLSDFHGATTLLQKSERGGQPIVALCTDCHGVHDITKTNDPSSKVMKANLTATCRKCHSDATDNFPAAWLSHYEPTLEKAPLVFAVAAFYKLLIPFMIGSLVLQIALHLWRVVVNR